MWLVLTLVTVFATLLLLFLDKIIEYFSPEGSLSASEEECDNVMSEGDCLRVHTMIE